MEKKVKKAEITAEETEEERRCKYIFNTL